MAGADYAGPAADLAGGAMAIGGGAAASKLAWSRTKRMMQNKVQWHADDLAKAGFNRILAANPGGSMGGVNAQTINQPKLDLQGAQQNAAQRTLLTKQGHAVDAKAEADRARAELTRRQAGLIGPASNIGEGIKTMMDRGSTAIRSGTDRRSRSRGAMKNFERQQRKARMNTALKSSGGFVEISPAP